jgi:hypothetical protein
VSILTLKPIDPGRLPAGLVLAASMRGITIYWQVEAPLPVTRGSRKNVKMPLPVWQSQRVGFHAVAPTGQDVPPRDAEEQGRYVRAAYVLVACTHPIPSDAEIRYTVHW